jgi:transporter family protein
LARLPASHRRPGCFSLCRRWRLYFRALKLGQAAQVAPIDKMSVVLVAIFGVFFLGEKLAPANWLGIALIAAGAVLVAWRV